MERNKLSFLKSIKVATLYSNYDILPYAYKADGNETKYITDIRLISILSKILDVKLEILRPADGQFGNALTEGNWSGMIGMVLRGEADFAISKLSLSEKRATVIDFSVPYQYTSVTFITDKPKYLPDRYAIVHPFSLSVWVAVVTIFLFMQFLIYFLKRKEYSLQSVFFKVFGSLLEKSVNLRLRKVSIKVLVLFWIIGAMLLTQSYKAVLLSFLTFPTMTGIRNIEQLAKAIEKSSFKCSSYTGSTVITDVLLAGGESWAKIGECLTRSNAYTSDIESFFKSSKNPKAFVGTKLHLSTFHKTSFISEDSFYRDVFCVVVSRKFCCKDQLDKAINTLFGAGILDKFDKDERFFHSLRRSDLGNEEYDLTKKLSLEDLFGAFIILACGVSIASVVLILEKLFHRIVH